jgi:hypothetical protein
MNAWSCVAEKERYQNEQRKNIPVSESLEEKFDIWKQLPMKGYGVINQDDEDGYAIRLRCAIEKVGAVAVMGEKQEWSVRWAIRASSLPILAV